MHAANILLRVTLLTSLSLGAAACVSDSGRPDATFKNKDAATSTDMGSQNQDMGTQNQDMGTQNQDMGTQNQDMGTQNQDMGTQTPDMGTQNPDMGTQTPDMGTQTPDMGTQNPDMGTQTPDAATGDGSVVIVDGGPLDAGNTDGAVADAGTPTDASVGDTGPGDVGPGDGGVPSTFDPQTAAAGFARAICQNATRCIPAYYNFQGITEAQCIAELTTNYLGYFRAIDQAVTAGTVTYNAAQYATCLNAYATNSCDLGIADGTCDFFDGAVARGGACSLTDECSSNDFCTAANPSSCGSCQPRANPGQSCAAALCTNGNDCLNVGGNFLCIPDEAPAGANCGTVATGLCRGSLQCVTTRTATAATCQAPGTAGQSCSVDNSVTPICNGNTNNTCVGGLCQTTTWSAPGGSCTPPATCTGAGTCNTATNTCDALPGVGQACNGGNCADGFFCNSSNTCTAVGGVGASCTSGAECQDDLICTGSGSNFTCQPWSWQNCSPTADAGVSDVGSAGDGGGSTADAGVSMDAGGPSDGGTGTDAGTGPVTCTSNAQCGMGQACLETAGLGACTGAGCQCFDTCSAFAVPPAVSGCSGTQACTWTPAQTPLGGVCVPDAGGGLQGATCTATFNAQGQQTSNTCNGSQNFFCSGATMASPAGICTRICDSSTNALCSSLTAGMVCTAAGAGGVGLCTNAPPAHTDIGNSCTTSAMCQSMVCSAGLGNICSADCSGINTCPTNSQCVVLGSQFLCARSCTPGTAGDTACAALNMGSSCFNLGGGSGVCIDLGP